MTALALVLAVVLVALTVAGILGRIDGSLGEPTRTTSYLPLPEDRLTPADIESLRLDTALRGYRMSQVDEVVGRLAEEIAELNGLLQEQQKPHGSAVPRLSVGNPPPAPATGSEISG